MTMKMDVFARISFMKIDRDTKIILIGASTGGPGVIETLISALPKDFLVPICIVQHFPSELTHSFVSRLQTRTLNRVVESQEGLMIENGMIIVAKGGSNLGFYLSDTRDIMITQISEEIRNDFIPSVDAMMLSASSVYKASSILAILLSGIGDDGVEGMIKIKREGGYTICQDEKSSAVFGMPGRAVERGGASAVMSVEEISREMIKFGLQ